ncbi:MAG TPA: PKD domain-containing protein [Vicinamibacterales bacterium]|nr:PKD domain-containing protein [Vicinamibacterales bacterium]
MLPRPALRRLVLPVAAGLAAAGALAAVACEKLPLLAPTGTVITLYANSNFLPLNSSIEITAVAIEGGAAPATGTQTGTGTSTPTAGQGTPVHNGTVITFTTTVGRIEPQEARTRNGQVTVRLISGGQSGIARVRAFSGGAQSNELQVKVGTAGVERILLSASPQSVPSSGGTAIITAHVEDEGGAPLAGLPVTFTTTAGTLNPTVATTDDGGDARTTLTTALEAQVSAAVGGKTAQAITIRVNPRSGVTITAPTTPPSAGTPAIFTIGVSGTASVRNVTVDWGDGSRQSLGALSGSLTISHIYRDPGTYTVTATATTALGDSETVATAVTVLPVQPPSVIVNASDNTAIIGQVITFTATVSGNISPIQQYTWNFGDGTPVQVTTGNQTTHAFPGPAGTYIVTVTVQQATGPTGQGQTQIVVCTSGC